MRKSILAILTIVIGSLSLSALQAETTQIPNALATNSAQDGATSGSTAAAGAVVRSPGASSSAIPSAALSSAWQQLSSSERGEVDGDFCFLVAVVLVLFWFASTTEVLRDDKPQDFGGATWSNKKPMRRTFSLAQSQMAWWFLLVLAAYLYLFRETGTITLSAQALTLMGLGSGTALGAAMIESNKGSDNQNTSSKPPDKLTVFEKTVSDLATAKANKQDTTTLEQQRDTQAPDFASKNFFNDILTDVNGISLHRFQSFVWTLVMGGIFLVEVVVHKKMPQFDEYTLALLGISSGTYLALKIPEQPN